MKAFCGRASLPVAGFDCAEESEEYDHHQEIARSRYADMLHDRDRNDKYYRGIRAAVARVRARGEKVIVLDIGTGTGLLSMMAVTAGADLCYAVEVFEPMAAAAKCIVEKNGFADKIKVINKHSTDVTVGPGEDMETKANVLITELFDTELIGEGALPSYEHAHRKLVREGCEAVPHRATVYAQLVESQLFWSWARLRPVEVQGSRVLPPPAVGDCSGAHSVCDIQLSQISPRSFTALSPVCAMFTVDFSKPVSGGPRSHSSRFAARTGGRAQAVLSWWDLDMDPGGGIVCTVAPGWTYPRPKTAPWRDHWMQSVYFLPEEREVAEGQDLSLVVCHDDYSLWYGLGSRGRDAVLSRPSCTCRAHLAWTRARFGELNDEVRTERYVSALRGVVKEDGVCVGVSDGSLLPVFAHLLGAKKVLSLEKFSMSKRVMEQLLEANSLGGRVELLDIAPEQLTREHLGGEQISLLIGEPYFCTSLLPWHSLFFWYCRSALAGLLRPDAAILPRSATLHMVAVEFRDLWRIRAPCVTCEGFDVTPMDEMIQKSLDLREAREAEPHPLWEYPCRALTPSAAVMTFDFTRRVPRRPIVSRGSLPLVRSGRCHGVAAWMEYSLSPDISVSEGLRRPVGERGDCEWSRHRKQGVYFFRSAWESSGDGGAAVVYDVKFEPASGDVTMDFNIESR
ncbi:protein arginine N-methyltransferase 7 [Phyllopteryx taeniolatus]|uniref:protein arginine N-methyltransferase 7 n=1 Tax=Phyllopteryx taeniolatus TaxID=161469 RepID=UPI002AD30DB7|nr:protein arginine N-methyltransferase 7 [Phyllopteryx taeniolatus]XP_061645338.1 protein arginine N-methyltransferase 7 [Phyllopteryx taeniolatus]